MCMAHRMVSPKTSTHGNLMMSPQILADRFDELRWAHAARTSFEMARTNRPLDWIQTEELAH